MNESLTRRAFAKMVGSAGLLASQSCTRSGAIYPFTLGVASGDPDAHSVVLWTRLAPQPFEPGGGMPPRPISVMWEVANDERFVTVQRGHATADPKWGHSVHVEVGGLEPARQYFYRFIAEGFVSPVGRTCTAPPSGARVDRLRIAFASCQHFEEGYFTAYRHMVADAPDLIVFLGDYIYETDPGQGSVRSHRNPRPVDLESYRQRYATYKFDPQLQAAHRAAPWVVTWDDHEVSDNYANALDSQNDDPATFLHLRAAAYQAYYEHMPLRRSARPSGPSMKLHRTIDWGALAQFQVVDDRQYRDPPPCQPPGFVANHIATNWILPDCDERRNPRRSIFGAAQERWLQDRLAKTGATWNLLTQQTLMLPYRRFPPDMIVATPELYALDNWAGFPAARDRVARQWRDARTPNPLVLSGDVHAFLAADHSDPDDPERLVASEFVGGSITSPSHDAEFERAAKQANGCRFANNRVHGYGLMDLTSTTCDVDFRTVSSIRDQSAAIATSARFAVEAGRPGIQMA